jgi:cytochrome b subunit of formate dehydrogenase
MKTLHWGFALCLVVLGITGIFMWNPYGIFPGINAGIDSLFRLLHDIFTFLFLGLIMGHIYFSVIPANWKLTRAMFTGSITKEAYEEEYNPERYPLPSSKKETEKKKDTEAKSEAKS